MYEDMAPDFYDIIVQTYKLVYPSIQISMCVSQHAECLNKTIYTCTALTEHILIGDFIGETTNQSPVYRCRNDDTHVND
jgi:hypothetical protein